MDKKIEAAIRETLVIGNPVSIKRCVHKLKLIFEQERALRQCNVSGSVLSDEEMREPIENALYATKRFLTTQATDLAEGILEYLKDAGFTIVRTDR